MVPTRTGKPGKTGEHFASQGILLRLEESENFTQNTGKIRKNYTGKLKKNTGKYVSQ